MCQWLFSLVSPSARYVFAVLGTISSVFTAGANVLCLIVFWQPSQRSSKSNRILWSLAISDCCVGLLSFPMYTWLSLHGGKLTKGGCIMEDIFIFLTMWMVGCSSASVVFIAYDRYLLLTKLSNYNIYMNKKKMNRIIISYWTVLFGIALASILNATIFFYANIFLIVGPLASLITCYYIIWKAVKTSRKQLLENMQNQTADGSKTSEQKRHLQLAKKVSLLIVCYLLSLAPFLVWLVLVQLSQHTTNFLTPTVMFDMYIADGFIGLSNSSVNPVIYILKDKEFRKSFLQFYKLGKRVEPTSSTLNDSKERSG